VFHRALRTRLKLSTSHHPQTDGQSEIMIQTLEDMLRACILEGGGSWNNHLPLIEFFLQQQLSLEYKFGTL
jgi:hypothetical protein